MKKTYLAITLAFLLVPAVVLGQTTIGTSDANVVLYGQLDVLIDTVHFAAEPAQAPAGPGPGKPANSGQNDHYLSSDISYWGIRGTEELGGGMHAYFKLESGFFINNGETQATQGGATPIFNRESYVGLGSDWGSIQAGSQWSPSLFVQVKSDPFQRHSDGSGITLTQQTPGNIRGFLGWTPVSNAVEYISPNLGGFSGRALYAFSNSTDGLSGLNQFAAASLEYAAGPLYLGLSYEDDHTVAPGPIVPASTSTDKTFGLGASYDFQFVKLFGFVMKNTLAVPAGARPAPGVLAFNTGLNVPIGNGKIEAAYGHEKMADTIGGNANFYSIGYIYNLSKRTYLYASTAAIKNGSASHYALWPTDQIYAPPTVAGGAGLPGMGQNLTDLQIGLHHNF